MYGGSRHSKPVIRNLCSLSSCRKGLPSSSFIHKQTLPTHVMVANAQENCRLWLSTGSANESPQAKTHLRPVSYGQCLHFQGLQKKRENNYVTRLAGKAENNYYLALYKKGLLMTGQSNTKRAILVCCFQ